MCGIAGIVGIPVRRGTLEAMARAMVHRGPDDEGIFVGPAVGLAFRRLAIIDLSGGHQPMGNEDGQVQVVFNGEIYDHLPWRALLEQKGHRFATDHSDTEVLVHGWEEWGEDLFAKLNGMFAVAVWDQRKHTLVLARDRYGIKPLYYAPLPGGALAFASEVRALFASGLVEKQPSAEGILEYWSFQNLVGRQTMFRGIYQLEAGTLLTWRDHQVGRRQYWDISFPRRRRCRLPDLAEEHRAILTRALRRQIAADVPVKTYLSGGIDSTAITVVANCIDPNVTAYSCIFDLTDVGADRAVDEREYSRLVARAKNIERIEVELPADHLRTCLRDYVTALEDLRMGVGYPVLAMARRVAQDAKVVLSGTGGDEFHAGYVPRYQSLGCPPAAAPARRTWRQWLGRWRRAWNGAAAGPSRWFPTAASEQAYRRTLNFLIRPERYADVFQPEFLRSAGGYDPDAVITSFLRRCSSRDWRDVVLYVDAKTYLAGLLTLEDKLSMFHSLETRVPLLDNELVDFVLDVPFDALWQGDTGKVLFRESVRPLVPPAIYAKPKMGFGPPESSWYRGRLRPWLEEVLSPRRCAERGIFRPAFVADVLEQHLSGRADLNYLIWSLLNFEAWCEAFGFYGASARTYARSA